MTIIVLIKCLKFFLCSHIFGFLNQLCLLIILTLRYCIKATPSLMNLILYNLSVEFICIEF